MATITREQAQKINSKCENNFSLDLFHFCSFGEKQLHKFISTGENKKLCATLMFYSEWDRKTNTTTNLPTIHFAEYAESNSGMMVIHGIGYFVTIGKPVARKNTKALIELTSKYDNDVCLKMYEEQKSTKVNMFA